MFTTSDNHTRLISVCWRECCGQVDNLLWLWLDTQRSMCTASVLFVHGTRYAMILLHYLHWFNQYMQIFSTAGNIIKWHAHYQGCWRLIWYHSLLSKYFQSFLIPISTSIPIHCLILLCWHLFSEHWSSSVSQCLLWLLWLYSFTGVWLCEPQLFSRDWSMSLSVLHYSGLSLISLLDSLSVVTLLLIWALFQRLRQFVSRSCLLFSTSLWTSSEVCFTACNPSLPPTLS